MLQCRKNGFYTGRNQVELSTAEKSSNDVDLQSSSKTVDNCDNAMKYYAKKQDVRKENGLMSERCRRLRKWPR